MWNRQRRARQRLLNNQTPISIRESGKTIVGAFTQAGILSFIVITILLALVLRSLHDVLMTLAPLVLTGLLTLASCVVLDLRLNFANVIGVTSTTNTISKFDKVRVGNDVCPISEIRPIDVKQMKADRRAATAASKAAAAEQ